MKAVCKRKKQQFFQKAQILKDCFNYCTVLHCNAGKRLDKLFVSVYLKPGLKPYVIIVQVFRLRLELDFVFSGSWRLPDPLFLSALHKRFSFVYL